MHKIKKRNKALSFLLAGAMLSWVFFMPNGELSAEESHDGILLEGVEVTASRRTQQIQDVPNSISAIGLDTIKDSRIQSLKDTMELVPNASVEQSSVGDNQVVVIRGVGSAPVRISESAFGLYRNGAYFGGARTNIGTLVDLKRIEILRGPQGGLYGRNAVAGTVNLIYATPTDSLEGSVSGMYGSFKRTEFEGVLNVPVVKDKFAIRVVGWHLNQDEGEHYNAYLNEYIDKNKDTGGRLSARWTLTPDLKVNWSFEQQNL